MAKIKKLTANEMKDMEFNHLEKKCRLLEITIERQKLITHNLQKELLDSKMKDQKVNLEAKVRELETKNTEKNETHKEFVQSLKKKHKIKGSSFGYNPDTGEILED